MTDAQIFQFLGLTFFAIGLGMLITPDLIKNLFRELEKSIVNTFYGGLISLAIGFPLVTFHNIWVWNWSLLITIIGWLAIFKGLALLIAPQATVQMYKHVKKFQLPTIFFVLGLGLLMLFLGYFYL